jgi:hypothetical protein
MKLIDWVIETTNDVIDAFFIQSNLVDVKLTDTEMVEKAALDELTNETLRRAKNDDSRPIGKKVL